jgi:hypothetical protein
VESPSAAESAARPEAATATAAAEPVVRAVSEPDRTFQTRLATAPGATGRDSTAYYYNLRRALREHLGTRVELAGEWAAIDPMPLFSVGGRTVRVEFAGRTSPGELVPGMSGTLTGVLVDEAPWTDMREGPDRVVGVIEVDGTEGWRSASP